MVFSWFQLVFGVGEGVAALLGATEGLVVLAAGAAGGVGGVVGAALPDF